ncbi:MAG: protein kinase [Polyangia bacterium]
MKKPLDDTAPGVDGFGLTQPVSDELVGPVTDAPPLLMADEQVAGRYRVVRFLARGGMGEVYEVEDGELHEIVALKTIRGDSADGEARFRREIQLARKVTHINVCRIFDVGYHERDGQRIMFLTMELLGGRTLVEHLQREGPLPLQEAMRIVRQIAGALGAAHTAGVVHRDLKSANVMLVPRGQRVRVAVTDFGLAHGLRAEGESGVTAPDMLLGTPGYMAPEQVQGGAITPRTDIYALGIVMYELLTGRMPFEGATALSVATKRLTIAAPSPKKLRADLPARWERAVLACLERDPARRPESARAVLELLGAANDSIEEIDGTVRVTMRRRRIPLVRPALGLFTVALGAFGVQRWYAHRHAPAHVVLAALPLTPQGAEAEKDPSLGGVVAEVIQTRLGASSKVQLSDEESVRSAEDLVQHDARQPLNAEQLERLRQLLGVDLFVVGHYELSERGTIHVEASLVDAVSKKVRATVKNDGTRAELAIVLGRLADELGRAAGIPADELQSGLDATLPQKPETLRTYAEASQLLARGELGTALATVRRVVAGEPEYARGHLLLAEVAHETGNLALMRAEANRATALASTLPRRERLFTEGVAAALVGSHTVALDRLRLLHRELPADLDLSVRLARELTASGHGDQSLELVESLRVPTAAPSLRHRLDGVEADAAVQLGDLDRALTARRRAAEDTDALQAKSARARDRLAECQLLMRMDRTAEAHAACFDSRAAASEMGERRVRALASNELAWIDFLTGKVDDAETAFEALLPSARELGDEDLELRALGHLGTVAYQRGDLVGARRRWDEALRIAARTDDDIGAAPVRQALAMMLELDGQLEAALQLATRVDAALKDQGLLEDRVGALCRTADIQLELGRQRELEQTLADVDAVRARAPKRRSLDECLVIEADVESGRGHLDRAAAKIRAAVDVLVSAGQGAGQTELRVVLATILDEAHDAVGARRELEFIDAQTELDEDDAVLRDARLLRVRLDGRDPHHELEAVAASVAKEPSQLVRAGAELSIERTRAVVGKWGVALSRIAALVARARRAGWVRAGLKAELYGFEIAAAHHAPPSVAVARDYAARARLAGMSGWAERVLALPSSE